MLEKYTLGRACGSGCVHDTSEVIGLGRIGLGRVLFAELHQLVEAEDLDVRVCAGECIDVLLLRLVFGTINDNLYLLCFLVWVDEFGEEYGIKEHELGMCLKHRVLEAFFSKRVVGRHDGS